MLYLLRVIKFILSHLNSEPDIVNLTGLGPFNVCKLTTTPSARAFSKALSLSSPSTLSSLLGASSGINGAVSDIVVSSTLVSLSLLVA
jgi:hypothetical protein